MPSIKPGSRLVRLLALASLLGAAPLATCPPAAAEPEQAGAEQKQPAKERVLFDGKSLKGWQVADKFDFEEHGQVKVEKGQITLKRGSPATGIHYQGKLPRVDYEVSLEARRTDGDDFFCGLTFPVGKDYCTLIIGGWGGGATGLSNIDGMSAIENETTGFAKIEKNRWYRIRLRVGAEKIEAWFDKEQIVDLKTADRKFSIWWEQEPMRPLGIASWNTGAALRNIRLKPLANAGGEKK